MCVDHKQPGKHDMNEVWVSRARSMQSLLEHAKNTSFYFKSNGRQCRILTRKESELDLGFQNCLQY